MKFEGEVEQKPLVIYGGNGFVGAAICEMAARQGFSCISVSRRGAMPKHLQNRHDDWLGKVKWIQGDALNPDKSLLATARAVIATVGSPPVPTFSQTAYDHQLKMNGATQQRVIESADSAGVNRVVVIGADIPFLLRTKKFAYYQGKQQAFDAAQKFVDSSDFHQAAVLQPAAIYGTRYTHSGKPIPLFLLMKPASKLLRCLPESVQHYLPSAFVDVKKVASAVVDLVAAENMVDYVVDNQSSSGRFIVVKNTQLQQWPVRH